MSNPLIYAPQGNMGPEHIDEHRKWYMSRHAPTLMGVVSAPNRSSGVSPVRKVQATSRRSTFAGVICAAVE